MSCNTRQPLSIIGCILLYSLPVWLHRLAWWGCSHVVPLPLRVQCGCGEQLVYSPGFCLCGIPLGDWPRLWVAVSKALEMGYLLYFFTPFCSSDSCLTSLHAYPASTMLRPQSGELSRSGLKPVLLLCSRFHPLFSLISSPQSGLSALFRQLHHQSGSNHLLYNQPLVYLFINHIANSGLVLEQFSCQNMCKQLR